MKLQTLRSQVQSIPRRVQTASPVQTNRIRGRTLQTIRERIMHRDMGLCRCALCLRTEALTVAHEVEHRIPLWAGGQEQDSNRYAINRSCHKAKTDCEAGMRARGAFDAGLCRCGRHEA